MHDPSTLLPQHSQTADLDVNQIQEIERQSYRAGVKASAPTLVGIAAWGLVVGVAMIKSHLSIVQALGMTLLVFAGSAQLAALPLMAAGAPIWVIFITGLMVNLRFVIFSVIMAPHFSRLKLWQRGLWGYLTGDVSMVFFMNRYSLEDPEIGKFGYMKGLFIPNWCAWQIGSIAGIFLGSQIPQDWGVGFAGTLAVLCVLLPMVLNRAVLVGVVVTGGLALATYHWPYRLGMLLSVLVGMLAAMAWQEWAPRSAKERQS